MNVRASVVWLSLLFMFTIEGSLYAQDHHARDHRGAFVPTPVRSASGAMWSIPPQVPHLIIRGPQLQRQTETAGRTSDPLHDHGRLTVDGAVVDPVWKQPYAYGYFGALPYRHWKRHYGYHGSYTQWSFK